VNGNAAYEGEMNEVALFMSALRAALPAQPDPELGAILVPRLAQTARTATIEAETRRTRRFASTTVGARRRPRSRLALAARVGITVALIPLVLAALAFAGVTLPPPARSAFESVGVNLPNQPAQSDETSTSEGTAQPAEPRRSAAGSKGDSVAAHRHALEERAKARGEAVGHTLDNAIGLNEARPPGQSSDAGPPPNSNAGGSPQGQAHRLQAAPEHAVPIPGGQAPGLIK
jgi:hypothetical protein